MMMMIRQLWPTMIIGTFCLPMDGWHATKYFTFVITSIFSSLINRVKYDDNKWFLSVIGAVFDFEYVPRRSILRLRYFCQYRENFFKTAHIKRIVFSSLVNYCARVFTSFIERDGSGEKLYFARQWEYWFDTRWCISMREAMPIRS